MKISTNFRSLSLERKREIKNIAIGMHNAVNNYYYSCKYSLTLSQKLHKSYVFFQKYYKSALSNEEKSVFYLYVLFPNDNYFMELLNKYGNDFEEIANTYLVPESVVRMRYILQRDMMPEQELDSECKSMKKAMN